MNFEIIVNKETKETIPYKKQIVLDYEVARFKQDDESIFYSIIINSLDFLKTYFIQQKEVGVFLIESMLLLDYSGESNHYVFVELPEQLLKQIKLNKIVTFVTVDKKNKVDFTVDFEDINIV